MTGLLSLLARGMVLGLAIAAPVGPIGVLCIRRTLSEGRLSGFVSGLGAATADLVYGWVAAFGLTAVSGLLVSRRAPLQLLGGLFLCYLGLRTLLARPAEGPARAEGRGLRAAYFSTFALTLTNPMTILSFAAVFAGMGMGAAAGYLEAAAMVLGVFLGSASWWFLLSGGVGLLRARFDARGLLWVNRVSGLVITGFGVAALAGLLAG